MEAAPLTLRAPGAAAAQNAVRPALEAIKLLIEKLKPLVLNAAEELKKNSIIAAKATAEWNTTVLQPWAAQTGQAIKARAAGSRGGGHSQPP